MIVLLLSLIYRGGNQSTEKLSSTELTCDISYLTRGREFPAGLGSRTFSSLVYSGSVLHGVKVPHLVHNWSTAHPQSFWSKACAITGRAPAWGQGSDPSSPHPTPLWVSMGKFPHTPERWESLAKKIWWELECTQFSMKNNFEAELYSFTTSVK